MTQKLNYTQYKNWTIFSLFEFLAKNPEVLFMLDDKVAHESFQISFPLQESYTQIWYYQPV